MSKAKVVLQCDSVHLKSKLGMHLKADGSRRMVSAFNASSAIFSTRAVPYRLFSLCFINLQSSMCEQFLKCWLGCACIHHLQFSVRKQCYKCWPPHTHILSRPYLD